MVNVVDVGVVCDHKLMNWQEILWSFCPTAAPLGLHVSWAKLVLALVPLLYLSTAMGVVNFR